MPTFSLPYGRGFRSVRLPARWPVDEIALAPAPPAPDPFEAVAAALDAPLGDFHWSRWHAGGTAAIAINDKTRPVPHEHLLPPLLARLRALGFADGDVSLHIATGAHPPMPPEEYGRVVPPDILDRYPVFCHDTDDQANLIFLGQTPHGTPVWINRRYMAAERRIVVGNIEPHQFQGFSGGVKSAAIGLAGRATINHNHALMTEPEARAGEFDRNPARQDVEAIGRFVGVHLALNAVLNADKRIVRALAGEPVAVMAAGIPLARQICQVVVKHQYDLVIASPGGHPKDINLYQAQKGLAHASLVARVGGRVILLAACPEGSGSRGYETWVQQRQSPADVMARFAVEGFQVGPHKAFQFARDTSRLRVRLVSDLDPGYVRTMQLQPAESLEMALAEFLGELPSEARLAVMPRANATIPLYRPDSA